MSPPANPAMTIASTTGHIAPILLMARRMAIREAPPKLAMSPMELTAPEVPVCTTFPVVISRGGAWLRRPSSELQVSAVAAAIPPDAE
ncbi:MAG: hypothetical protein M9909_09545 [Thermomicrobiales bacterium]|nr:hypothetical protein [Thermomicrobiales bacterium]